VTRLVVGTNDGCTRATARGKDGDTGRGRLAGCSPVAELDRHRSWEAAAQHGDKVAAIAALPIG
jgi:hypothetical protein